MMSQHFLWWRICGSESLAHSPTSALDSLEDHIFPPLTTVFSGRVWAGPCRMSCCTQIVSVSWTTGWIIFQAQRSSWSGSTEVRMTLPTTVRSHCPCGVGGNNGAPQPCIFRIEICSEQAVAPADRSMLPASSYPFWCDYRFPWRGYFSLLLKKKKHLAFANTRTGWIQKALITWSEDCAKSKSQWF